MLTYMDRYGQIWSHGSMVPVLGAMRPFFAGKASVKPQEPSEPKTPNRGGLLGATEEVPSFLWKNLWKMKLTSRYSALISTPFQRVVI